MVNVDRCLKMTEIEHEREIDFKQCPNYLKNRPEWPENGAVEFKGVKLKYRPDTDVVLNGITFKVKAGEKVGIVGRTGAGKSTICLCMSRIIEIFEGSIHIDGIDI